MSPSRDADSIAVATAAYRGFAWALSDLVVRWPLREFPNLIFISIFEGAKMIPPVRAVYGKLCGGITCLNVVRAAGPIAKARVFLGSTV
jgi:hypothetical protein